MQNPTADQNYALVSGFLSFPATRRPIPSNDAVYKNTSKTTFAIKAALERGPNELPPVVYELQINTGVKLNVYNLMFQCLNTSSSAAAAAAAPLQPRRTPSHASRPGALQERPAALRSPRKRHRIPLQKRETLLSLFFIFFI